MLQAQADDLRPCVTLSRHEMPFRFGRRVVSLVLTEFLVIHRSFSVCAYCSQNGLVCPEIRRPKVIVPMPNGAAMFYDVVTGNSPSQLRADSLLQLLRRLSVIAWDVVPGSG